MLSYAILIIPFLRVFTPSILNPPDPLGVSFLHDQFAYFVVNLDISVCFFDDGGHIDMKFHPSQGCDQPILSASPHDS